MVTELQYPHRLYIKNYEIDEWELLCPCRDQPNDEGKALDTGDGRFYTYSSLVFANPPRRLKKGLDIQVRERDGFVRLEATVKRFSKDLFHSRIWV